MSTLREIIHENVREGELYEKLDRNWVRCFACGHCCKIPEGQRFFLVPHGEKVRGEEAFVCNRRVRQIHAVPPVVDKQDAAGIALGLKEAIRLLTTLPSADPRQVLVNGASESRAARNGRNGDALTGEVEIGPKPVVR
jgi:hypothetical protein